MDLGDIEDFFEEPRDVDLGDDIAENGAKENSDNEEHLNK